MGVQLHIRFHRPCYRNYCLSNIGQESTSAIFAPIFCTSKNWVDNLNWLEKLFTLCAKLVWATTIQTWSKKRLVWCSFKCNSIFFLLFFFAVPERDFCRKGFFVKFSGLAGLIIAFKSPKVDLYCNIRDLKSKIF